jgi:hypothetical protein
MKSRPLPPLKELREHLDYNPDTGILIWKKKPDRRVKIGEAAGRDNGGGYLQTRYRKGFYLCSRLAYYIYHGVDPLEKQVDHINGNRLDNRIKNLRLATGRQNSCNKALSKRNTSGVTGVRWAKREKKWIAYITANGKMNHLGYFINKEDAIQTRREAEVKYFGDFRRQDEQ